MGKVESIVHFGTYSACRAGRERGAGGRTPADSCARNWRRDRSSSATTCSRSAAWRSRQRTGGNQLALPTLRRADGRHQGERGKRCLRCKYDHYPICTGRDRPDPGRRSRPPHPEVVLAKGRYGLVAGFVDIGESLEPPPAARSGRRSAWRSGTSNMLPANTGPSEPADGRIRGHVRRGRGAPGPCGARGRALVLGAELPDLPGKHSIARFILDHYTRPAGDGAPESPPAADRVSVHSSKESNDATGHYHRLRSWHDRPEEAVLRAAGVEYRLHQQRARRISSPSRVTPTPSSSSTPHHRRVLDGLPAAGSQCDTVWEWTRWTLRRPRSAGDGGQRADYCIEEVSDHAVAMLLSLCGA